MSASVNCETIVQNAYQRLNDLCNTLERNHACYGHEAIRTELIAPWQSDVFSKGGDKAPVKAIRQLYTLPMDVNTNTWGLSLLKVQTNLPDTAPGQNVIFVLYGDVSLTNADETGKMNAFYFTSGLGQPACKSAPPDGIIVRSPKGTRVQFNANGVSIDIGSTVVLVAQPNQSLTVQLLEGSAKITSDNKSQWITSGQAVDVPLGGIDGLQAIGTPSAPKWSAMTPPQRDMVDKILGGMPIVAPRNNNNGNGGGSYNPPPAPTAKPNKPRRTPPPPPPPGGGDDDDDDD